MAVQITSRIRCGFGQPLLWVMGPCVIEPGSMTLDIAGDLVELAAKYKIDLVFKASFDKANRSSSKSYRGPGINDGMKTLEKVKNTFNLPIVTDVHEIWQIGVASHVCDILQIPAFLARQTDLVQAAGRTGLAVNVKKGQFMAPWDMKNVIDKLEEVSNNKILLTERGSTFGYGNLVVDMRSLAIMQKFGYPVIFDATHSVQLPGAAGDRSSGDRTMVPVLARAAIAAGCDGLFLEVHRDPDTALSDGPNMISIKDLPAFIESCLRIRNAVGDGAG